MSSSTSISKIDIIEHSHCMYSLLHLRSASVCWSFPERTIPVTPSIATNAHTDLSRAASHFAFRWLNVGQPCSDVVIKQKPHLVNVNGKNWLKSSIPAPRSTSLSIGKSCSSCGFLPWIRHYHRSIFIVLWTLQPAGGVTNQMGTLGQFRSWGPHVIIEARKKKKKNARGGAAPRPLGPLDFVHPRF